jgi:hypothetical protein
MIFVSTAPPPRVLQYIVHTYLPDNNEVSYFDTFPRGMYKYMLDMIETGIAFKIECYGS